ncbi:YybH family protein [Arenimonas terrae]|uniref:Uncharacterized protein n=1 Tax=Arenimonas terrae TaxID=2546226 RepID=A0A5C4RNI6_9GAMM|nr:hypothetical protein [Arenimonas terrae]TNJ32700.1 hypothetical protein E1B00_14975 [Arenimonas terrae]
MLTGFLPLGLAHAAPGPCGSPDETISRHLAAIQARDLPGIEATVTRGAALVLILPDGVRTDTREAYLRFHRAFFRDRSWRMRFEEVSRISTPSMTLVALKSSFRATPSSAPRSSWLSMGFGCEAGQWRLVFDQNTRLPEEAAD